MRRLQRMFERRLRRWLARIQPFTSCAKQTVAPPSRRLSWRRPASSPRAGCPRDSPQDAGLQIHGVLSFCIFLSPLAYNKARRKFAGTVRSASKYHIWSSI